MADMKAYPVIFSAPMVLALLDGRKFQARRVAWQECKTAKQALRSDVVSQVIRSPDGVLEARNFIPSVWQKRHDKFHAGERPWLWVKETHWRLGRWVKGGLTETGRQRWRFKPSDEKVFVFEPAKEIRGTIRGAEQPPKFWKRPSIFMPKWASRISLRVTNMRIERLQDISEEDARAEGVGPLFVARDGCPHSCYLQFRDLWNSIHGPDAWDANPEVVVTEFEVHKQNIGSVTNG